MLQKVGLLPKDRMEMIPGAWKRYIDVSDKGWKLSRAFKKEFGRNVTIDFVGVFDTVSSAGYSGMR